MLALWSMLALYSRGDDARLRPLGAGKCGESRSLRRPRTAIGYQSVSTLSGNALAHISSNSITLRRFAIRVRPILFYGGTVVETALRLRQPEVSATGGLMRSALIARHPVNSVVSICSTRHM
jgi:hypothetical protein